MVVKPLMKMEDGVDSGKQLSEKDGGSNLFSLPPALLFPASDCLSFNEEPAYLKGPFRAAERWGTFRHVAPASQSGPPACVLEACQSVRVTESLLIYSADV